MCELHAGRAVPLSILPSSSYVQKMRSYAYVRHDNYEYGYLLETLRCMSAYHVAGNTELVCLHIQ